jgi:hypothetical protein
MVIKSVNISFVENIARMGKRYRATHIQFWLGYLREDNIWETLE